MRKETKLQPYIKRRLYDSIARGSVTLKPWIFLSRNLLNTKGTQWLHFSMYLDTLPVGHSSNHQYHCCQLKKIELCFEFLSHFKVFIWFSLVFDEEPGYMHISGSSYFVFSFQDYAQFNHGSVGIVMQNRPRPLQITPKCITYENQFLFTRS